MLITNSNAHAIELLNTTGDFAFDNVTITDSNGAGINISNGGPNVSFDGAITGSGEFAIDIAGTTGGFVEIGGTIHAGSGSEGGVDLSGVDGDVTVHGLDVQSGAGRGIDIFGDVETGNGNFTFNNLQIDGATMDALRVVGGAANVTANLVGGGISHGPGGEAVEITGTTGGSVTFNGAPISDTDGRGIYINSNQGTVTFNSDVDVVNPASGGAPPQGSPSDVVAVDASAAVGGADPGGIVEVKYGSARVNFSSLDISISTTNGWALWSELSNADLTFGSVDVNSSPVGGIHLQSNSGTFTFNSVDITFTSGKGIRADNTGGIIVNGASNTISTIGTSGSRALDIGETFIDMRFQSVTCDTCNVGIELDEVDGDLLIDGGAINGTFGTGIDLHELNGDFRFDGTIFNESGQSVVVDDSDGIIQFGGAINDDGMGIRLEFNSAATTIRFDGGLDLDTGTNTGLSVSSAGTLEITGTNTIDTSTGIAVDIEDTTIGASGVTFQSISSNGASTGIKLEDVTGGNFTVTGVGTTAGSGGLIQNSAGLGINLNNSDVVFFENLDVKSSSGSGVFSTGVFALTFENATIQTNGSSPGQHGIHIFSPTGGTASIQNSSLLNNYGSNIDFSASSGLGGLSVTGSTISQNQNSGDPGIRVAASGTGNAALLVGDSTISQHLGTGVEVFGSGSSSLNVTVTGGNDFDANWDGLTLGVDGSTVAVFDIAGNTFSDSNLSGDGFWQAGGYGVVQLQRIHRRIEQLQQPRRERGDHRQPGRRQRDGPGRRQQHDEHQCQWRLRHSGHSERSGDPQPDHLEQ